MDDYRRLLGYAARYWRGWFVIGAATLLSTGATLAEPWPMKIFADNVLGGEQLDGVLGRGAALLPFAESAAGLLIWVAIASVTVFGAHSALNAILTRSWIRIGQQMVYDLAQDLFGRIQRRSFLFHGRHPIGDSITRVTEDSWCVHTLADELLVSPMHALIASAGMLAIMASLDLGLMAVSLVVTPLMVLSSVVLGRPIRAVSRTRQEIEGRLNSHVQQTLSGVSVVQGFSQEDRQRRHFQEVAAEAIRASRRSALATAVYALSGNGIGTLGVAVVLWVGGLHVLAGQLSVGSMLVFITYIGLLQEQFKSFTLMYSSLQAAGGSIDRVMEVLQAQPEVADRVGARRLARPRGELRLEGVSFGYEFGQPVLREVSLAVEAGQTVAIVGPTGAGKSTLVSLVPRFFDPWSGRVLVDGQDVRTVQLKSLRAQVALVLQDPFLFPLSIADNIAYGRPEASLAEIEVAARAANAHSFITRLPNGYQTVVGERGATLSGGERQRLSIARALLKDAPILILDEPTSALDAATEGELLEALQRLMVGRTTLIIAHRLSTIRHADWIVVLDQGRVVDSGTHAALLARDGLYARFHHPRAGGEERPQPPDVVSGEAERRDLKLTGVLKFDELPILISFLARLRKSGQLLVSSDAMAGALQLEDGVLIGAIFGHERGTAALSSIAFSSGDVGFTFEASSEAGERNLLLEREEVPGQLDALMRERTALLALIPSLSAVPRLTLDDGATDSTPIALDRDTLRLLLAVDGHRTVADLGHERGLAQTLRQLAHLAELRLAKFELHSPVQADWPGARDAAEST